ncbi:unnamed protein product [Phytophthora lilii]|uniref:Unnamed protein product n=1 Tax=Phytophthora lilii TaxID=2077276 RepID=A0A9W6T7P9_9STRA|nr:unnamed protein product [Phytophthora lilii]
MCASRQLFTSLSGRTQDGGARAAAQVRGLPAAPDGARAVAGAARGLPGAQGPVAPADHALSAERGAAQRALAAGAALGRAARGRGARRLAAAEAAAEGGAARAAADAAGRRLRAAAAAGGAAPGAGAAGAAAAAPLARQRQGGGAAGRRAAAADAVPAGGGAAAHARRQLQALRSELLELKTAVVDTYIHPPTEKAEKKDIPMLLRPADVSVAEMLKATESRRESVKEDRGDSSKVAVGSLKQREALDIYQEDKQTDEKQSAVRDQTTMSSAELTELFERGQIDEELSTARSYRILFATQ